MKKFLTLLALVTLATLATVVAVFAVDVTSQGYGEITRKEAKNDEGLRVAINERVAAIEADVALLDGEGDGAVNQTLTNGEVIVPSRSTVVLDASGQSTTISTNTLPAPVDAGYWVVLINGGASNSVLITEGTTLDSGGNKTLGPEDVMLLFAPSAASWSGIYHDN